MAEFGENLKRVREEKGITQQTLADRLYVTRQTVSRWEGGSRYPDLMTAKKMAQYLEVSLDDLLSDDDMELYVKNSTILDSPVAKRVQIVLMALAFMSSLMVSVIYLSDYFIQDMLIRTYNSETLKSVLLTIILGIAVYTAIYDKLNPKVTMVIFILYYGMAILTGIGWVFLEGINARMLGATALNVVLLVICISFFCSKKMVSPIPLYIVTTVYGALGILNYFIGLMADIPNEIYRDVFKENTIALIQNLLVLAMLMIMVHSLHRKRKLIAG